MPMWSLPRSMTKGMSGLIWRLAVLLSSAAEALASRATPHPDPTIMTNFLTEADLNRALWNFIYALAGIAGPIFIVELLNLRRAWKTDTTADIKKLNEHREQDKLAILVAI